MIKGFAKKYGFSYKNTLDKQDESSADYDIYFKKTAIPNSKPRNIIRGNYRGKSIVIYEQTGEGGFGISAAGSSFKIVSFFIDGQMIYGLQSSETLLPLPKTLIKIIDNYITRGILPEPRQKAGILVFVFLIFFILFILVELLIHSNFKN
jgi:hypothetical protein